MCDFREFSNYVEDKETGKLFFVPYMGRAANLRKHKEQGWFDIRDANGNSRGVPDIVPVVGEDKDCPVGVYHVCASGSYYAYFDGTDWLDCYNNPKLNFIFHEKEEWNNDPLR